MRRRRLGCTDLDVPVMVCGAYAFGGGYWGEADDRVSIDAVRAAVDSGMDAFDTAPVYGFGRSEEVLGRALHGIRDRALIFTKVGVRWDGEGDYVRTMPDFDGTPREVRFDGSPASVRLEVERSLKRLGTDRIDLIQVHAPCPDTPIPDTMGALLDLRSEGKVREIGVSNFDVEQLEEARLALGDVPLASDQPQFSLLERSIERDVLPWARRHRVGILAYAPLDQGVLSGRVGEDRAFGPREGRPRRASYRIENRRRIGAALDAAVRPLAEARGATVAQIVLAWTVAVPGVTAALVGSRTPEQARENAAAGDVELKAEELEAIDRVFSSLKLEQPRRPLLWRALARICGLFRDVPP